jgi:hypothetical protein
MFYFKLLWAVQGQQKKIPYQHFITEQYKVYKLTGNWTVFVTNWTVFVTAQIAQ